MVDFIFLSSKSPREVNASFAVFLLLFDGIEKN